MVLWLGRPAGQGRSRKRRCPRSAGLHRPHTRSDVDGLARDDWATHLDTEPGASSKVTSLFSKVTGSPPVATSVARAAQVVFGANYLSSVGDAAMVRAPRSSNPTSVHPSRRSGVGAEVSAWRWAPGQATASAALAACSGFGESSSELDPCRRSICPGASVLERRCSPSGGHQGRRHPRRARSGLDTAQGGSSCGPDLFVHWRSRAGEGPKAPSWSGRASGRGPGMARLEGRSPSSLGFVSSPRMAEGATGRQRSTLSITALRPCAEARGTRPESKRTWIEVVSLRSRLTSGELMSVVTSTCLVARSQSHGECLPFPKRGDEVAAEGALGIDHPARRVDPREGAEPGLRGNSKVLGRASTWRLRV